ncbi:apolipoprotein N-acyltransferase copper homeostasis protein [Acinetobacter baumannii ATCC 17978]|nr:apolipoprotein N-acyltransferase copper homeostasis protein [Acinetobacter baumannii ATCC 17978]
MRAYFEKLLDSSQQQKQLPLIFHCSLLYFQVPCSVLHWHLIIGGGWQFCLQPYSMRHCITAQPNKHLQLAGVMVLVYGL